MSSRIITNQNTGVLCGRCNKPMVLNDETGEEQENSRYPFLCETCGNIIILYGVRLDEYLSDVETIGRRRK